MAWPFQRKVPSERDGRHALYVRRTPARAAVCRDSYYHGKAVICPDGPTTLNMQYAALDFHLRLCRGVGERAAAQRARLERVRPQLPPPSGCPRDRTRARAPLQTVPARPGRRVRRPLAICPPAWCKAKGRKGFAPLLDIYFYLFSEAFANPTPPTEGAPQRVTHSQLGGGTCHDSARTGASITAEASSHARASHGMRPAWVEEEGASRQTGGSEEANFAVAFFF